MKRIRKALKLGHGRAGKASFPVPQEIQVKEASADSRFGFTSRPPLLSLTHFLHRYLLLLLVLSERAWAFAMELKQLIQDDKDHSESDHLAHPRAKFMLARRLSKAVRWSSKLHSLALQCADQRTSLESEVVLQFNLITVFLVHFYFLFYQAYANGINGTYLLEVKDNCNEALGQFTHARYAIRLSSLSSSLYPL